jgi:hypothetical protein
MSVTVTAALTFATPANAQTGGQFSAVMPRTEYAPGSVGTAFMTIEVDGIVTQTSSAPRIHGSTAFAKRLDLVAENGSAFLYSDG